MILLKAHSLTQVQRVPVVSMPLVLKERETTASLVPESMSGITTESWFLDDTNPGKGIVYRVRSIQTAFATNTPTIQLEHVIRCLADKILFGEITPAKITGDASATTCTAKQAVQYILKKSEDWTLGKFDYSSVKNAYKFDGDNLLDALEDVSKTLEDCRWTYDLSVYPFKLNIIKKDKTNPCEMRPGRNLVAVTKTIDKTGMYTRFYPIGKNDLHLSGNGYVQKNTDTYGIVEKNEVDSSRETEAELKAWANQRLKVHAQPRVQVVVEGMDLSAATGEDLDTLTLGRACRIPLEEFSTTIEEEIVELNYRDKKNEPENVRLTLANEQEDIVKILANEIKEGAGPNGSGRGGGGRGGARQQKEDNAWFEDTNDHVAMCARGIIGVDANGKVNWERLSRLEVNEGGIFSEVRTAQGDATNALSRVEQTENSITATVEAIGADGEITAASICLAINEKGSNATISADRIVLSGKTTINDILRVGNKSVSIKTATRIEGDVMASSLTLRSKGSSVTIDDGDLEGMIKEAKVEDGVLKLKPVRGDEITFSKATSNTQSWSSGNKCVKATASGASDSNFSVDYRFNASSGQYYIELFGGLDGASNPLNNTSRIIQLGLNGNTVEIQNGSGVKYNNTPTYTITAPTWSHGNLQEQNGQPSGAWATFTLDTRYTYHYVYVTVDGTSKMLLFRT